MEKRNTGEINEVRHLQKNNKRRLLSLRETSEARRMILTIKNEEICKYCHLPYLACQYRIELENDYCCLRCDHRTITKENNPPSINKQRGEYLTNKKNNYMM